MSYAYRKRKKAVHRGGGRMTAVERIAACMVIRTPNRGRRELSRRLGD